MKSAIGIFGGTFDPIHKGHLLVAKQLLEDLELSEIKFIPCKIPVHKNEAHASGSDRCQMIKLAIQPYENMNLDTRELERPTPSYMVETLQSLHEQYPEEALYLIIGLDCFLQLHTWYQWKSLKDYANIIVVTRPGHECIWPKEQKHYLYDFQVNHMPSHLKGEVYMHPINALDISSTSIRQKLAQGVMPNDELSEEVINYVRQKHLYGHIT